MFAVAIFMGMFSVSGFATRNIQTPTYDSTSEKYEYNYVYFGGVINGAEYSNPTQDNANATSSYVADTSSGHSYQDNGTTKYALKFRVLDTTSNDGETPALFMLTEYAIGQRRWDTGAAGTQDWGTSEMRRWLNGYTTNNVEPVEGETVAAYYNSVLPTCFSKEERAAIMETTTHEAGEALCWHQDGAYMSWAGKRATTNGATTRPEKSNQLEGDKIFLLSAEEVTNQEYGFVKNNSDSLSNLSVYGGHASRVCALASVTGGSTWWWLRSA